MVACVVICHARCADEVCRIGWAGKEICHTIRYDTIQYHAILCFVF